MRLAHVIDAVMNRPWAITTEGHRSIVWALEKKLAKGMIEASEADVNRILSVDREGMFGKLESKTVKGTTAYIPVYDILSRRVSRIEKSCGVTDYADIQADLSESANDPNVSTILLCIDSPGGTVSGLYECFDAIEKANAIKPVIAFTGGADVLRSVLFSLRLRCNFRLPVSFRRFRRVHHSSAR